MKGFTVKFIKNRSVFRSIPIRFLIRRSRLSLRVMNSALHLNKQPQTSGKVNSGCCQRAGGGKYMTASPAESERNRRNKRPEHDLPPGRL